MAWAIVARRALSPSTPRAQGAPLRASGVDRSARPSKWLSCQQCEDAPLGLPRSIFNRHPPEVSITEICYQFRVSHMGCSPGLSPLSQEGHTELGTPKPAVFALDAAAVWLRHNLDMKQPVVSRSPDVMRGTAVIQGTRVAVQTQLDYLEAGEPSMIFSKASRQ